MSQDKQRRLFDEFPPVSTSEWESKILEDLKGADYEKKLVWSTVEGLKIRPYYRAQDLAGLNYVRVMPGQYPFVRGNNTKENHWDVRQDLDDTDPTVAGRKAVDALDRGAEAIGFNAENIHHRDDLRELLTGLNLRKHGVHFLHSSNYKPLVREFVELVREGGVAPEDVKGSVNFDPIGFFVLYGRFYGSATENYRDAAEIFRSAAGMNRFKLITVNGQHYHNAGAHIVQEIAFSLLHGNEYLAALTQNGLDIDQIASRMQFTLAIGSNFFMEIAKLRAIKLLWAKVVEQYQPKSQDSLKICIHATSSLWNKSIYDPYVNMLRTTTETMAAALAGVDSITVAPFDTTYKKADEFSLRIARNQQIILREESYFSKVVDPAAGSYYIEKITDQIAEAAWKLFVDLEEAGGFVPAAERGLIISEIEKTCQKRDMEIAMRRQVFVGVNQYPNTQEKMLDKVQPTAGLNELAQLKPYRGVQAFEAIRMAVENHVQEGNKQPVVYLFTWGNLAMRKARATFSANFFGCAGYNIIEGATVENLNQGIEKALAAYPDIVAFCSSDEEYSSMIPAVEEIRAKQPSIQLVVAGNPQDVMEQLNNAGVQHYIHLRTNTLEALRRFNDVLGIV